MDFPSPSVPDAYLGRSLARAAVYSNRVYVLGGLNGQGTVGRTPEYFAGPTGGCTSKHFELCCISSIMFLRARVCVCVCVCVCGVQSDWQRFQLECHNLLYPIHSSIRLRLCCASVSAVHRVQPDYVCVRRCDLRRGHQQHREEHGWSCHLEQRWCSPLVCAIQVRVCDTRRCISSADCWGKNGCPDCQPGDQRGMGFLARYDILDTTLRAAMDCTKRRNPYQLQRQFLPCWWAESKWHSIQRCGMSTCSALADSRVHVDTSSDQPLNIRFVCV